MHLLDNGIRLNLETPFRHGLLLGGIMADESFVLRMDIADPIGTTVQTPFTNRPFQFDRPTIGMLLIRKDERAMSCLFPLDLLFHLQAELMDLTTLAQNAWQARGGEPAAVARTVRAMVSALNGVPHRPDRFGVRDWAPSLSMPFGLVMAGQWLGTPETAEPLTYTVETAQ
jgi:hypothetical protein